jgi:hypothetical protein
MAVPPKSATVWAVGEKGAAGILSLR